MNNQNNSAIETLRISLNREKNRIGSYGKSVGILHRYKD
jgi:hypothetical protein